MCEKNHKKKRLVISLYDQTEIPFLEGKAEHLKEFTSLRSCQELRGSIPLSHHYKIKLHPGEWLA